MTDDPREKFRKLIKSEEETQAEPPVQPARQVDRTLPPMKFPALDKDNMPLPRRVSETDVGGTRVTPAAFDIKTSPRSTVTGGTKPPAGPSDPLKALREFAGRGCVIKAVILLLFVAVILGLCMASAALYEYYSIASALPSVSDLKQRSSQFETTRILDRNGNLLYEIVDPNAGRRTYVPLDRISPSLVAATIATEDKEFYSHPGYDLFAIARALWQNYVSGETVSGASTITQQMARSILLSPSERSQRTYLRKAREIILAAEITRRYTRDEILEIYLNEIYYGNLAYGVQAAAETYFGTSAENLTLAQAAFLAGLPQSPSVYDIHTNRDATLARDQQVLSLMLAASYEQGCIHVSNSAERICVDADKAAQAYAEVRDFNFPSPDFNMRFPHWVNYVRSQLELQPNYDPQSFYRAGWTVQTTLDPTLQEQAQQMVTAQVANLEANNAHDGALVAIKPSTGEILAMVGSADYYNEAISGQVNMAVSATRQPGSAMKPVNYVAAFEKGWTPATLIWDVPSEFPPSGDPNDTREPYKPNNYDGKFHGPVTVRTALANSFNVPAVKTLQFVGVYGPGGMVEMAKRLGYTSLTRDDYGLALTLGGGDVSLLEMVQAYSVFANNGVKIPPVSILKITDYQGKVVYEYQPPQGEQVIRPEHAYLITSILSDNEARSWMFGRNSALNLSFPVAAKTGTTNDFRDNWTMGYTPDLVVGVWVGNADYTPMLNTTGTSGAAPIWSQFMEMAAPYVAGGATSPFKRPDGIVDKVICSLSGTEPSQWCKSERSEIFAADQGPLPSSQDLRREVKLDTWTGLEASDQCGEASERTVVINVKDEWARKWFGTRDGRNWLEDNGFGSPPVYAPERECRSSDPHATMEINVQDGQVVSQPVLALQGTMDATGGFKSWLLEFGLGANPDGWTTLAEGNQPVNNASFFNWDLSNLSNQTVTLHLYIQGEDGFAEKKVHFVLALPTPTPPPTGTAVPPTATWTSAPPTATDTIQPPTAEPPTAAPTETPTP
ncbi:MAG TPA: PBP1A family penicillin-binding protein [Anaerolineales bacterium]